MCQVHIVSYRCYRAARLASDTENAKQPEFYVDPKKLGAFSVQFSGHKKSRKRLFFNDLRLSFCGESGILTYISHYFVMLCKYAKYQYITIYVISCHFAIFRIKMGDYLGDYIKICTFDTNNLLW